MEILKEFVHKIRHIYGSITFKSSKDYWVKRYKMGDNSGYGSYGRLAQFKADVINHFVITNGIKTMIEFGCGDGHQLTLAKYPCYSGYDISPDAIALCRKLFVDDPLKSFYLMDEYKGETVDLSLSLDVIYHLVEEDVFEAYMKTLFNSSTNYVIIYSTDYEEKIHLTPHIRHRHFTEWVEVNLPKWTLITRIPNIYSEGQSTKENSKADFFIYKTIQSSYPQ